MQMLNGLMDQSFSITSARAGKEWDLRVSVESQNLTNIDDILSGHLIPYSYRTPLHSMSDTIQAL